MITKERLQELIEQEATIWNIYGNAVKLLNNEFRDSDGYYGEKTYIKNNNLIRESWGDEDINLEYRLKQLFETKEDAEFVKEFGCIERTERLELPTWEELFKEDRVLDCYTQEFGIVKNRSFIGVVLLGVDFTNEIVEVSIGSDQIFCELLTKENYTLACRKAKELFLGERE